MDYSVPRIGYSCCVAIYTVLRSLLRERISLAPKERELKMASYIREVIDLLSDDDSKVKVEQIISSPEKQPPLYCKKRQPFSSLNGRDLRKVRTNDVNKGTEDPRSRMRRLLRKEDSETTYLFSTYKKRLSHFLVHHHVILLLQL